MTRTPSATDALARAETDLDALDSRIVRYEIRDESPPPELQQRWRAAHNRYAALRGWMRQTPPHFHHATVTDTTVSNWIGRFINASSGEFPTSPRIHGPTGVGKTFQIYGALRRLAESGVDHWRFLAVTEVDLLAQMRPRDGIDSETVFERYAAAPLLFLDDLGAAKHTPWTEEVTYRVMDFRWSHNLPTIVTSNLTDRELRDLLGGRSASRLTAMTDKVVLEGIDLRRKVA